MPEQRHTKKKGKLTMQCDELWSFVDHQGNKQWLWLALDARTREIVGVYKARSQRTSSSKTMGISTTSEPANVQWHTLIFGLPMEQYFPLNVIKQ